MVELSGGAGNLGGFSSSTFSLVSQSTLAACGFTETGSPAWGKADPVAALNAAYPFNPKPDSDHYKPKNRYRIEDLNYGEPLVNMYGPKRSAIRPQDSSYGHRNRDYFDDEEDRLLKGYFSRNPKRSYAKGSLGYSLN